MTIRRMLLQPLVPVYTAALALEGVLRSRGRLPVRRLPDAVISVGSLSAGGAGKTPLVLALAKALTKRDYAVRILTRGYGRRGKAIERVDPEGDPARFGDEPVLLAQRSGVPVFVGADRYRAGLLAQELPVSQRVVYLLDDGFQHRRLARDMDVVLLTRHDLEDLLLPAGNLREPLTRLREADVVVLREEEREALAEFVDRIKCAPALPAGTQPLRPAVWVIRRRLDFGEDARLPERPLVFCGIARPESFIVMLAEKGVHPAEVIAFRDHHAYSEKTVGRLIKTAKRLGVDAFVTTEKDAVKLTSAMRSQLRATGPLLVPRLVVDLVEEKAAVEQILSRVSQLDRRRRVTSA